MQRVHLFFAYGWFGSVYSDLVGWIGGGIIRVGGVWEGRRSYGRAVVEYCELKEGRQKRIDGMEEYICLL